jgi:hypothetical protein
MCILESTSLLLSSGVIDFKLLTPNLSILCLAGVGSDLASFKKPAYLVWSIYILFAI